MIKLIASDLDGTLLKNGSQRLSEELPELIIRLKERGIYFVAASGRQLASMYRLFEPVKDDISYVGENGTICVHNNRILSVISFEPELAKRIVQEIRKEAGCEILVSCVERCYIESKQAWYQDEIQHVLRNDVAVMEDLLCLSSPFLKVSVCSERNLGMLKQTFQRIFGSKVKLAEAGGRWLDFIPAGADKSVGLRCLLRELQIEPEECMAFGDQVNDIEMLELVGKGYAMQSAAPGVAEHCSYRTDSVEKVLRELLERI